MEAIRRGDRILIDLLHHQLQEYIVKPVPEERLKETVASLIEHIRQNTREKKESIYLTNNSRWDMQKEAFYHDGKELSLTPKEKELLALLFQSIQSSLSYSQITLSLWGEENNPLLQKRIKTLIKQLRKKLPVDIIKNVFAYGYKIEF